MVLQVAFRVEQPLCFQSQAFCHSWIGMGLATCIEDPPTHSQGKIVFAVLPFENLSLRSRLGVLQ